MFPNPTADPIAARMKTLRDENEPRCWSVYSVAALMHAPVRRRHVAPGCQIADVSRPAGRLGAPLGARVPRSHGKGALPATNFAWGVHLRHETLGNARRT